MNYSGGLGNRILTVSNVYLPPHCVAVIQINGTRAFSLIGVEEHTPLSFQKCVNFLKPLAICVNRDTSSLNCPRFLNIKLRPGVAHLARERGTPLNAKIVF